MRRPVAVLVLCAVATTSSFAGSASAGNVKLPKRCEDARRVPESNGRGRIPVLLVHGFFGAPGDFRTDLLRESDDEQPTMLETVAAVDGATAYTFDYSEQSERWVTDQAIAPALAASIRCLERAAKRPVVVVAHSMGALATRSAQGQVIDGRAVSESLSRVITVGAPTRGVILLKYTNDRLSAFVIQTVVNGAGELCSDKPAKDHRRLCELLDAANAPATIAMQPGSGQLGALPAWGSEVVVHPIAADLRVRVSVLGLGTTASIGDVVTTVGSATADASPGEDSLVVECDTELSELVDDIDESPCAHGNVLANRRIIAEVRAQVALAVRQDKKRSSSR